jgi:hypothetical protein
VPFPHGLLNIVSVDAPCGPSAGARALKGKSSDLALSNTATGTSDKASVHLRGHHAMAIAPGRKRFDTLASEQNAPSAIHLAWMLCWNRQS